MSEIFRTDDVNDMLDSAVITVKGWILNFGQILSIKISKINSRLIFVAPHMLAKLGRIETSHFSRNEIFLLFD